MKQFRTICIGLDQFWTKHTVEVCVPYIQKRVRCNGKNASIFHTYRVCCCYSWGTLRAIYTHAIILTKPPNGKKQTANGISMLIFRQLWNEWVSLHTHTWTLKHTHVSSSIELACCRLLPCCLCMCLSEILFLLLYACDDFCLLAFIFPHLYSTVVRRFFFSFYNVAVSLFLFVSIFISFSLFVCCLRWAVQFFVELLLYILWHFLHHFVCIACFGVAAAFVVPLVNPFIDSFNFVLQAYFRCRSISSQLMLYSQPNDASVCRCINYFSL